MFYLTKLRREIAEASGLFPGKTKEEVIEILRRTREQVYEEKKVRAILKAKKGEVKHERVSSKCQMGTP
jgi:hypothetical protein